MSDLPVLSWMAPQAAAWLLTYALHSTLFLGLAWLVSRRLDKRMPRVEEAVWRFALVAALVTASVQLASGREPLAGRLSLETQAAVSASSAPSIHADPSAPLSRASSPRVAAPSGTLRAPSLQRIPAGAAPAGPVSETPEEPLPVSGLLMGLWAAGALLLSARWLAGHVLLRRRLRARPEVVGGHAYSQFASLLGKAGLDRPVRLTCSSRLSVPVALGLSRAEVCVPPRALASLTAEEQEGMLAHELAHVVRRDPFWLAFGQVVASVFFFQPLNWLAYRRLREISELLCDEWAIGRTGKPVSLARCLAEVAGWSFQPVEALAAPGMADRPSHLAHRIRRLLDGGSPERRVHPGWLVAGMIVLLLAVAAAAPGVYAAGTGADEADALEARSAAEDRDEQEPIDEEAALSAGELAEIEAEVEAELAELGELDELEDLDELDQLEASELSETDRREAEEIGRRYEQMAREMSERIETQIAPQMRELERKLAADMDKLHNSPEMKRLHERAREIAERARPSEEAMARLHAEAEKLRKDGGLSVEERRRLRDDARRLAEKHRMSDEDRAELRRLAEEAREMSRKFNEEHRAEMEQMRREVLQQSQALREQMRRELEADPKYRELRERHRADRERHRERIRKEHEERRERMRRDHDERREERKEHRQQIERRHEREHRKERHSEGAAVAWPDVEATIADAHAAAAEAFSFEFDHDFDFAHDFDYEFEIDPQLGFDFEEDFQFDFEGLDFEYEAPEAESGGRR